MVKYFWITQFRSKSYSLQVGILKENCSKGKEIKPKACTKTLLKDANLENNYSRNGLSRCYLKLLIFSIIYILNCYICSRLTYQVFFKFFFKYIFNKLCFQLPRKKCLEGNIKGTFFKTIVKPCFCNIWTFCQYCNEKLNAYHPYFGALIPRRHTWYWFTDKLRIKMS